MQLVVQQFLTLDGVVQAPGAPDEDPSGGFGHGGWLAPYGDEVFGEMVLDAIEQAEGFLLGRTTYEIFAGYWPNVTDPDTRVATLLNKQPKYVASRTLDTATWDNTTLLKLCAPALERARIDRAEKDNALKRLLTVAAENKTGFTLARQ